MYRRKTRGVELWSLFSQNQDQRSTYCRQPGCAMARHKMSCLAAVFASFCVMFMPGGTNGCTGQPTCTFCVNFWIVVCPGPATTIYCRYYNTPSVRVRVCFRSIWLYLILNWVSLIINVFMNPKLPLNRCIFHSHCR